MQTTAHLMPPMPHACPACGTDHDPALPHNALSLYYQMRFHSQRGRWPTWADAAAHCIPRVREMWREVLIEKGAWTEPPDGAEPIADPPAETTIVDLSKLS